MLNKRNLYVSDAIIPLKGVPILNDKNLLKEALEQMIKFKYGVCFCVKKNKKLCGILTDGDIRRKILNIQKPFSALLNDDLSIHINTNPKKIKIDQKLTIALKLMEKYKIWDMPVVDKKNNLVGMLHMHSIIKIINRKK